MTGKREPKLRLRDGASTAVRGAGPEQTAKSRQRIKRKSSGRIAKPDKPMVAKAPLDESAAQVLAAIVQSSDAANIGKTLAGIVTSWNRSAERIFLYTASEMIGKPIHLIEIGRASCRERV